MKKMKTQFQKDTKLEADFKGGTKKQRGFNFFPFVICVLALFFYFHPRIFHLAVFAQDRIIAIVNNDVITQKDLNDFVNFMRMQLTSEYEPEEVENKIGSMKSDLLEKLIEDRLILQEAKKSNIKVDESLVKARIQNIKSRYGQDAEFQAALKRQGLVQADIESRIREQLLAYNIINEKIRNKIIVNPNEVTDYYQKNTAEFTIPQQLELQSVATEDEEKAKEIFHSASKGQDLKALADANSLKFQKITVAKGQLRDDIEQAVFKLNILEVTGPIKIENLYYIFKLINIIPSKVQTLDEARDKIYNLLFNLKMQKKLTEWIDELKSRSYIKISQD